MANKTYNKTGYNDKNKNQKKIKLNLKKLSHIQ